MKNEKIFNALEHLEDRFIAEAMEQHGSNKNIDLQGEEPVDPYSEGVVFDPESVKEKNKSRFVKWAGLAAGVCAVAAGAVIMKNSGLFDGNISMPHNTLLENTQAYYTTNVHDESNVKIYGINNLKEDFDLEELAITDSDLLYQMKIGYTVTYEDKLYYAKSFNDRKKAVLCAYDIKENTYETVFEINSDQADYIDLTVLYNDGSSIYYRDDEYIVDGIYLIVARTCICRYDMNTKTHEDIFSLPFNSGLPAGEVINDRTGEEILGKIKAVGGCLFFEHTVYVSNFEKTENIIRYDMESGEKVTFKENAKIHSICGDKLFFCRNVDKWEVWKLMSCDLESGENEESIWAFTDDVEYSQVCYDGTDIWVVQHFSRNSSVDYVPADENRFGYKLRRLNGGLETVATVYDLYTDIVKSVQDHIVTNNMIFDTKSGECIMTGSYVALCVAGGELYCLDNSGSQTKVYRFNFDFSNTENSEAEPLEYSGDLLDEGFSAEMIEAGGSVKESLLNGLAAVQNDKVYYVVKNYSGNDFNVCSYDKKTGNIETLCTDYYDSIEKISYDIIGIYDNSLYYRLSLSNSSDIPADLVEFYCVKKLDLNSGESETIYNYTRKPADICDRAVIIDKYLFLEDTVPGIDDSIVYNLVRYDTNSGKTLIFKENALASALHKNKLIFCRKQGDKYSIYSCDLKSGENEEKVCDLPSHCIDPSVCSDGEKIWVSVLDTSDDTFTVGYLDENNNLNQVISSIDDYFPYEFKYANGYIVMHDMLIDVKSEDIIATENVAAVGNELYYGEYRRKYIPRTNQYQTDLFLYRLY